ncbi:MAG: DUF3343 domain-containing protein [Eggerthellaceae bacterium]|nr:DUF3343 domain-containing protein [Eggerthellaceae bacterium]
MAEDKYFVLADGSTQAFAVYRWLRSEGFRVRVAPVPRGLTACCGTSVMVDADEADAVRRALERSDAPAYDTIACVRCDFDPHRDRYC